MDEVKQEEYDLDYQFLEESAMGLEGELSLRQLEYRISQISLDIFKYEDDMEEECQKKE
jgi:hypothetical protein